MPSPQFTRSSILVAFFLWLSFPSPTLFLIGLSLFFPTKRNISSSSPPPSTPHHHLSFKTRDCPFIICGFACSRSVSMWAYVGTAFGQNVGIFIIVLMIIKRFFFLQKFLLTAVRMAWSVFISWHFLLRPEWLDLLGVIGTRRYFLWFRSHHSVVSW